MKASSPAWIASRLSFQRLFSLSLWLSLVLQVCLVGALENGLALPRPDRSSCFQWYQLPSCEEGIEVSNVYRIQFDVQQECARLDERLRKYDVVWKHDFHANAFADIQKGTDECKVARQAYQHCYWCLPAETISEKYDNRPEDFCRFDGTSSSDNNRKDPCAVPEHDTDPNLDTQAVCDELSVIIRDEGSWPASMDLCLQAEQAIHACDWYCVDGHRNPQFNTALTDDSCWTVDDPPDCTREEDDDDYDTTNFLARTPIDLDLEQECRNLVHLLGDDPWNQAHAWTHLHLFATIPANSDACDRARQAYPHCGFCHPRQAGNEQFCTFVDACEDAGFRKPVIKDDSVNMRAACQYLNENWQTIVTRDDCDLAEASIHACEFWCGDQYLGANTTAQKWTLVGLARVAAVLSLLGALFIFYDVLSVEKNRSTVYHQLLLGMAVFDAITAVAWGLSTAPLPVDEAWRVVGAMGNEATCTAQAFFIQLGYASIFYNNSLALYYVLVIVWRWREGDLRKIRPYLHGIPVLVGLMLACFLIPFADWTGYGCHILPPPDGSLWQSMVFVVVPLGFSIFSITLAMTFMYLVVRRHARASVRWSFGRSSRQSLEDQVFWQALLYTLSFYISWPILFAVYLRSVDYNLDSYVLTATVSFVAPLQGFTNVAVYVRPRVLRYIQRAIVRAWYAPSDGKDAEKPNSEHPTQQPSQMEDSSAFPSSQLPMVDVDSDDCGGSDDKNNDQKMQGRPSLPPTTATTDHNIQPLDESRMQHRGNKLVRWLSKPFLDVADIDGLRRPSLPPTTATTDHNTQPLDESRMQHRGNMLARWLSKPFLDVAAIDSLDDDDSEDWDPSAKIAFLNRGRSKRGVEHDQQQEQQGKESDDVVPPMLTPRATSRRVRNSVMFPDNLATDETSGSFAYEDPLSSPTLSVPPMYSDYALDDQKP